MAVFYYIDHSDRTPTVAEAVIDPSLNLFVCGMTQKVVHQLLSGSIPRSSYRVKKVGGQTPAKTINRIEFDDPDYTSLAKMMLLDTGYLVPVTELYSFVDGREYSSDREAVVRKCEIIAFLRETF